ncbi:TIGR00159 family protein [Tuanshanicoccus lijuaniae]|nr:TIGR00159 family protein [Aerococcaceae bacterium zg-1292]MBF6978380.1 TIGR00159 family protein [Aerococcaceae bacterium zg-BR22]MBS4456226.1 diadenylate cyclase CdaA [Aerococcaceae bacterium zg-A91]MBS4458077.1 diadenylate cyclase CdaA [Aerococcaceae bacterium zg-BR33]QQA38117.1 TIGR00159 family protein [Aerococcaceae bacterium zg-1292]
MGDQTLAKVLDILIVWFLINQILVWARGTRVMNILKGVALIFIARALSSMLGLQTIDWLLNQVISWGVVAAIILFQPEIRKALENLGRNMFRNRKNNQNPSDKLIADIEKSVQYMSRRKIGALISIEAEDSLEEFVKTGIAMDSYVSNQLLINIFIPNTPLHDGAVIISDYRIASASSYLPLSESTLIPKELGTRHRAAIGLGEVTDALTVIVSEETGAISLVKRDHLHRDVTAQELNELLHQYLATETPEEEKSFMQLVKDFFSSMTQKGESS